MGKTRKEAAREEPTDRLHRFKVLAAWFTEHLTINNYRPRTIADYAFEISFFRRWLLENTDLADIDDLTPQHLHDYTASLYSRNLATTSIGHKLAVLTTFLGTLYDHNKLYVDLRGHVNLPRLPRRLPKDIMTEDEVARVFSYLEETAGNLKPRLRIEAMCVRDHAIFEVLYSTGLRKAEVMKLCLDDVNYDDGEVIVREGKGGKDRIVPIGAKSLQVLRRYVRVARPLLTTRETPRLFVSLRGQPLDENVVRESVKRTVKAAGIARSVNAHAVRHCCATHMLNHGADIRYVQEFLGHASLSTTQVYTHVSIGKLKETHRRFHPREQAGFLDVAEEE